MKIKNIKAFVGCIAFLIPMWASYNVKNEKVVICGLGKNIAPFLGKMIKKIEALGGAFKDYRVIVYENNSTDNTSELLTKWADKNSKITVISEALSQQDLFKRTKSHAKRDQAPCRMELIAYGRNQVLQKALSPELDDFNFLIMTDMDFNIGWEVKDVLDIFDLDQAWDAITANGVDYSNNYYDRYAYRDERFAMGPEIIGEDFWAELGSTAIKFAKGSGLKKVYSAFGGLGIYRKQALQGCSYSGYITDEFELFMSQIMSRMAKTHAQYKLYKKTFNSKESQLPVIFQANCGYDGPVVCEHSTLHASMALRGFDKIYVNPDLVCRY